MTRIERSHRQDIWDQAHDVLVVGGGTTGVAAALAAARQGAHTGIVERCGYLGGNAVAIPAWLGFHDLSGVRTVSGIAEEMIRALQARGEATPWYRDPICGSLVGVNMHAVKLLCSELAEQAGVEAFLHAEVAGAALDPGERHIDSLQVRTRDGQHVLRSAVVVDCSDMAAVARPAGVPLTYGRGSDGKAQVASWTFTVGGVDFAQLLAYYRQNPGEIRPWPLADVQKLLRQMETAEAFVMGSFREALARARREGLAIPRDTMPGIAFPPHGEIVTVGVRVENVDPADSLSLGRAEREGMAQTRLWLEFLRRYVPGCGSARLVGTPATIGIRESYHTQGCYLLDRDDLLQGRRFDDAIAAGAYHIDLQPIHSGFDDKMCWVHARGASIPRPDGPPVVIVTMQKLLLTGCDTFYPLHAMRSDDDGCTWSAPIEQPGFGRVWHDDGTEGVVCNFTPAWHAGSGTLLGTGTIALYRGGRLLPAPRPRPSVYAVFNQQTGTFDPPQPLELPQPEFSAVACGCTQRLDLPDGDILLPVNGPHAGGPSVARVLRCAFDGRTMTVRQIGPPVPFNDDDHGLAEPSLTSVGGRYFLTLRNKHRGYVSVSDNGLTFGPPRPWTFDDGSDLGNCNTQQHWATRGDRLFLLYTRRGLDNAHVFRHRAPLVMAQVDPQRLCVIRHTERVVVPQRGARLGNFSVASRGQRETWVVVSEWMQNSGMGARRMLEKLGKRSPTDAWTPRPDQNYSTECRAFGSDNTVWAGRIRWHD